MNTDQSDEYTFVVFRRDEAIELILHDASQAYAPGQSIVYDVWCAVFPIVLSHDPELMAELTAMKVHEALDVGFGEDVQQLCVLVRVLNGMTSTVRAANIARSWVKLPLERRKRWWQRGKFDMPVHAQLLGAGTAGVPCLEPVVPSWLRILARTSKPTFFKGLALRWTVAETALGSSCIAWVGRNGDDPAACLAISTCPVQFSRADDPDLSQAKAAVGMLIAALNALLLDPRLAHRRGLHVTGHDAMEIYEILQSWIQRLTAAADAAKALGLSTTETWEQIGRGDGGRAAA
jgi:hypothetical protein